ncbi:nicotinamide phosphoribosyltransferase [Caulobacter phage phiCbK]|uniref:Nicotinamide phosphoribosyltransferase n=5 Tax=Viruses TaxID=10239 RepID=K4JP40_9CAUD|nr:nicotinamide phosphoribosyl transferase [Caulobacter phage phiCbK]AFO71675.1 nicotinamide phosphoribosyltransferase [Caulobacter phage phiCbK]AFU86994.1 putative nicotinate phosphoribosyltransferase [Caulobacter phage phiCbK]ARB15075.1 nicotinamide phosphoribosyltransferase [Caulobacter phage Ccr32]ARB15409.1 nicotinamide phosphoribosyltransferase [Caulobacter phage Ccr34]
MAFDLANWDGTPPVETYNLIADTDSYKLGHWLLYRDGCTTVYSYIESRGGRYPKVMLAAFQRLLFQKLGKPVTRADVEEMAAFVPAHGLPFNRDGWEIILNEYGGYLPLRIKAVPEGVMIPIRNALISVENLDPRLPWLTSYFETMILRDVWTASTIAARVNGIATRIKSFWEANSDTPMSPFAFLDFSSRGTMGYDHSVLAGIAHLFHFQGSDNVPGVRAANINYFSEMSGYSVLASEHSISCAFGRDNDDDYIDHCLNKVPPGSIFSLVGDTWDIFRFAGKLTERKELIANKNLTPVCRPDSGDLFKVIPPVVQTLAAGFGTQKNSHGLDVLNLGAKALQGDGMNENTHMDPFILARNIGVAPDSIITAAGGGLATGDLDRDTNKWAMKSSAQEINGEWVEIYKDPITDPGKVSKKGKLALVTTEDGRFETITVHEGDVVEHDLLDEVFNTGKVLEPATLDQIRERVAAGYEIA